MHAPPSRAMVLAGSPVLTSDSPAGIVAGNPDRLGPPRARRALARGLPPPPAKEGARPNSPGMKGVGSSTASAITGVAPESRAIAAAAPHRGGRRAVNHQSRPVRAPARSTSLMSGFSPVTGVAEVVICAPPWDSAASIRYSPSREMFAATGGIPDRENPSEAWERVLRTFISPRAVIGTIAGALCMGP